MRVAGTVACRPARWLAGRHTHMKQALGCTPPGPAGGWAASSGPSWADSAGVRTCFFTRRPTEFSEHHGF